MLKPYFENLWVDGCDLVIVNIRLGYCCIEFCIFNFVFGVSYEYYKT